MLSQINLNSALALPLIRCHTACVSVSWHQTNQIMCPGNKSNCNYLYQILALALTSYLKNKLVANLGLKQMSGQYFWLAQDSPLGITIYYLKSSCCVVWLFGLQILLPAWHEYLDLQLLRTDVPDHKLPASKSPASLHDTSYQVSPDRSTKQRNLQSFPSNPWISNQPQSIAHSSNMLSNLFSPRRPHDNRLIICVAQPKSESWLKEFLPSRPLSCPQDSRKKRKKNCWLSSLLQPFRTKPAP